MAPPPEPKEKTTIVSSSNAHSLRAAIFHTLAFKMSLEIIEVNMTYKKIFPQGPIQRLQSQEEIYQF